MAYTQTDLGNVEKAILELAGGERVVRLSIGGKDIEFSQARMSELKALRMDIAREIGQSARPRFYLTRTGKGL